MEPLHPTDPARVGGYRLTGRLGAGGMGQVYLARTPSGRQLVIKVIRTEHARDREFRSRFAREVEAARRVGGFHTAQVVDAAPDADTPWIATTYIPGPTLDQAVREDGPVGPSALHVLATGLTEGLRAVHARDLVHRDLKPGNIILAEDGPRIIDFGIARPLDADSMTTQGTVFGTLPYMSPEQTDGSRVGPASDMFSLGTVLAYAATGTNPFAGATMAETLRRLISPPPDPGDVDPAVRDLIIACWNHDPALRPAPEQVLARFQERELHDSWPPTAPVLRPAPGPRPAPAVHPPDDPMARAGSVTEVVPVPDTPRTRLLPDAESGTDQKDPQAEERSRRFKAVALGSIAGALILALILVLGLQGAFQPDTNASEDPESDSAVIIEHNGGVGAVAFSPDGTTLATSAGNNAWLWSADSGGQINISGNEDWIGSVEFTFDDDTLPIENGETTRLWYADTGDGSVALVGPEHSYATAFSPSGDTLVTAHVDGAARLWDVDTGERIGMTEHYENGIYAVGFSPDGDTLAFGHDDGTAHLWDVDAEEEIAEFTGHDEFVNEVVFSPDGDTLATGGSDGDVRLWDVDSGTEITSFTGHDDPVRSVAFSPDGTTLATGSNDSTARLWDIGTGDEIAEFTEHTTAVRSVAFSPDGTTLATGADDGTARLWPLD